MQSAGPPRSLVFPLSPPESKAMDECTFEALTQVFMRCFTSPAPSGFFKSGLTIWDQIGIEYLVLITSMLSANDRTLSLLLVFTSLSVYLQTWENVLPTWWLSDRSSPLSLGIKQDSTNICTGVGVLARYRRDGLHKLTPDSRLTSLNEQLGFCSQMSLNKNKLRFSVSNCMARDHTLASTRPERHACSPVVAHVPSRIDGSATKFSLLTTFFNPGRFCYFTTVLFLNHF